MSGLNSTLTFPAFGSATVKEATSGFAVPATVTAVTGAFGSVGERVNESPQPAINNVATQQTNAETKDLYKGIL